MILGAPGAWSTEAQRAPTLAARLATLVAEVSAAQVPSLAVTALAVETGWDLAMLWTPTSEGRLVLADPAYCAEETLEAFHRVSRTDGLSAGALVHAVHAFGQVAQTDDLATVEDGPRALALPTGGPTRALALPVLVDGRCAGVLELVSTTPPCRAVPRGPSPSTPSGHLGSLAQAPGLGEPIAEGVDPVGAQHDSVHAVLSALGLALRARLHESAPAAPSHPAPLRARASVPAARGSATGSGEHPDHLTGLLGRRGLLSQHQGTGHDLVLVDLDGFKETNERLGMHGADALLRQVGARLQVAAGRAATVARVGADEFAVVVPRPGPSGADVARDVRAALAPAFGVRDASVVVSASVVVVSGGSDVEASLADADAVLHSPGRRRAGVAHVRAGQAGGGRSRVRMGADLRWALARGQVSVLFQPVLDLRTGAVAATEALLRWERPEHGQVPPALFIPLAEDLGLIGDLGRFVLTQALAQQARWVHDLGERAPAAVAVNVSPLQVVEEGFSSLVLAALDAHGLPPSALTLEITETAAVPEDSLAVVAGRLQVLTGAGVGLDIDDFGTGHSSLERLLHLPVTALKIDRSFVRDLGRAGPTTSAVGALLGLSRRLDLRSVAEGVEHADHLAWLRAHGCDRAQGYLICEPVGPGAVSDLIRSGRRW